MRYDPRTRTVGNSQLASVLQWGQSGIIVNITPIAITLTGAQTSQTQAVSVDPSNTIILMDGITTAETSNPNAAFAYLYLTDGTTVTATRNAAASNMQVKGSMIQFVPGILKGAVQRGVTTFGASDTATQAITPVNTAKSILNILGLNSPNGSFSADSDFCSGVFTSSILLTYSRVGNTGAISVSWEVAEFA